MKRTFLPVILLSVVTAGCLAAPVGVTELETWMAEPDPPMLIDVRSPADYRESHLPGAISIPAQGIARRKLPPVGKVVAYGDGLGGEDILTVVRELEAKPGIEAFYLEGGMAAWKARSLAVAEESGVERESLPLITYRQAVETLPPDALLIDNRFPPQSELGDEVSAPVGALDDSVGSFAQSLGRPLFRGLPASSGENAVPVSASGTEPLYVLIDDDAQRATETARKLRDQGYSRVVILAGGVEIIQLDGQSGVERIATGVTLEGNSDE